MKKILTAIALSIALPAVAHAQTAPAPAAKMACGEKMKDKSDCCKDMAKMDHDMQGMKAGGAMPAGHDMSKSSAPAPADAHKNHQK